MLKPKSFLFFINSHDVGLQEWKNFKINFTELIQNQDKAAYSTSISELGIDIPLNFLLSVE